MKLSDVKALNVPFFAKPTNNFREAYPKVKSIRVEVRPDGEGFEPMHGQTHWLEVYTESNIPTTINCRNPRCYGGGLDLDYLIRWSVVESRQTGFETTLPCRGHEGSPKGRKNCGPCDTHFKVKVTVVYKDDEK